MLKEEFKALEEIANGKPFAVRNRLLSYLNTVEVGSVQEDSKTPSQAKNEPKRRTLSQNRAFHLGMQFIAETLNDSGYDMKKVLKDTVDIPWTKESVKEYIIKPVMKALYDKESTTELNKADGEIEKVWDVTMRHLGEKFGIEYVPFPNDEQRQLEKLSGIRLAAHKHHHGV